MAIVQLRKDAADLLGITPRQLGEWKHEDGFPDCSNGYDIDAIAKWREERNRKGSGKSEIDQQLRRALLAEKLKREKQKNYLDKLAIDEAEKRVIPREVIETFIAGLLSGLGDWCEQLPGLMEAELPVKQGKKLRARLETELRRMREQMVEDLKRMPIE